MSAYEELRAHLRQTAALGEVAGRLGWDQQTMMPRGANDQRAEEMAVLEGVLHARRTDPALGELLDQAEAPDVAGEAILREASRDYARNTRVPAKLASELARVTALSQTAWEEARAADDVAAFLPWLEKVVALRREEGQAIAQGGDAYDALMQDYEPGSSAAQVAAIFDRMRPGLVDLRDRILGAPTPPALNGHFPQDAQLRLAHDLARRFGYDFDRGRIDLAVHPFSSGSGADVRITTRVAEDDPFNCLYSTLHEVGHATYEQNIAPDYALTPLGHGVSMGVHESQSRIYENQLGRSRAFTGWLFGAMQAEFGTLNIDNADAFHAAVNRVHQGHIRTEADEVQYNLHIMLRFDLERALIDGTLAPADLEAAWNARFEADFGFKVDRPSNGVLQDVHWSVGLFGYFPTYALGNIYAGCLHHAMRTDIPELDTPLSQGDPAEATRWLADRVQRHGGMRPSVQTIAHACGGAQPDEAPLMAYLDRKFSEIYGL